MIEQSSPLLPPEKNSGYDTLCSPMEETSCPLCNSDRKAFLYETTDRLYKLPGKFRIVKCEDCTLIYLNPRPTKEGMPAYYPHDYFSRKETESQGKRRLKHWIRDFVLKGYFGYPGDGLSTLGRIFCFPAYLLFRMERRNSLVIPYQGSGKFLDVGCGGGKTLLHMHKMGFDTTGVEIDKEIASKLKSKYGINVFTGELINCPFDDQQFDVIHMSHLVEHLYNPVETLEKACSLLKPEGRLYLRLPDGGGFGAVRYQDKWFGLDPPRHLCTYTRRTISLLLSKTGFQTEYIKGDRGSSCLKNTYLFCGSRIKYRLAKIKPLMRSMEILMTLLRMDDSMIVCAKRVSSD